MLYCVGQFKMKEMVIRAGETILFEHVGRKKMEMPVDLTNHMPKRLRSIFSQLCHKHSGSSSEVELVMEALCPHWNLSRPLQRFSLVPVPSWDLSFWAKAIGLQFFRTFRVESKACANIATYSLNVRSNRCWRTLKTRAKVATHSLTVASNRCLPHPTPPHPTQSLTSH